MSSKPNVVIVQDYNVEEFNEYVDKLKAEKGTDTLTMDDLKGFTLKLICSDGTEIVPG